MYTTVERGIPNTESYRVFLKSGEKIISPFHDIPLVAKDGSYNMVVEIPRWTNAKMEIATKEPFNPIKQDVKKGKLRYVHNCFPHHGYIWNYGALPQTWENPAHLDNNTNAKGDNDPIDVCEIGSLQLKRGEVVPVKVLGVMALIDDGETDWKLLVINSNDPMASKLNDLEDIEREMPGLVQATHDWFKNYKIPDGKPPNKFAFNGQAKNKEFAEQIIRETHEQWKQLLMGENNNEGLALKNLMVEGSPHRVSSQESRKTFESYPEYTAVQNAHGGLEQKSRLQQYTKLAKIRLTGFVTSTAIAGSYLACDSFTASLPLIAIGAIGTFLCSSSAASINQFLETPYDSQMKRTGSRPLVVGQVSPLEAATFSTVTGLTGISMLWMYVNPVTAILGATNLVLYSFVYTPMKRSNVANTWIGSIVGAIPPLMGSSAVLGHFDVSSILLSLIMFSWQFPHFNALSWNLRHEYARAGYRMMSVVDPEMCKRVAMRHSILLMTYTMAMPYFGSVSWWFALLTIPLNIQFFNLARKFNGDADSQTSRSLFRFSLVYLPAVLGLLMVCKVHQKREKQSSTNIAAYI